MLCKNCNAELNENAKICTNCGAVLQEKSDNTVFASNTDFPHYTPTLQITEENLPENLRPLSPWAYFGLQILYSVPIIGLIFLIIFSFNNNNINRRNFTRSYWCILIIVAVFVVIGVVLGLTLGASLGATV